MGEQRRRNDPCSCGSGKKFKHCHLSKRNPATGSSGNTNDGFFTTKVSLGGIVSVIVMFFLVPAMVRRCSFQEEQTSLGEEYFAQLEKQREAKGGPDGTIADYTRNIERNPKDVNAYNNRGYARLMKGDFDGAIEDSTRAIELDPKNAQAYTNLGYAKLKTGDLDGAIADSTRAIELDSRNAYTYINRGVAKFEKGDLDGAIADCTRAIECDPTIARA